VEEEKRMGLFHLAYAPRDKWIGYDPTLISECCFAPANILSSLKLMYFVTVNSSLGPLKISLGRMVIDIIKFLFIALLVCFSFACGVHQLYGPYADVRTAECLQCLETKVNPAECRCDRTLARSVDVREANIESSPILDMFCIINEVCIDQSN